MLTTADLENMQAIQDQSMIDTCVIVTVATVTGDYGGQTQTTVDSAPTRCGLSFNTATGLASRRADSNRGPLAAVDAVLRLPLAAVLNASSRVRITKRNGEAITPQTFTIDGPVMTGRTCLVVGLKRIGA